MGETAWEDRGFRGDTFRALLNLLCLLCPAVESPSHEKDDFARYLGIPAVARPQMQMQGLYLHVADKETGSCV